MTFQSVLDRLVQHSLDNPGEEYRISLDRNNVRIELENDVVCDTPKDRVARWLKRITKTDQDVGEIVRSWTLENPIHPNDVKTVLNNISLYLQIGAIQDCG